MPQQLSAIVGCAAEGLDFYPHVERVAHRLGYDVRASQACEDLWDDRCRAIAFLCDFRGSVDVRLTRGGDEIL